MLLNAESLEESIEDRMNRLISEKKCGPMILVLLDCFRVASAVGTGGMAETVFSSIKRTFGEHVTARKFPHMINESCNIVHNAIK